jgi:signal peptidase
MKKAVSVAANVLAWIVLILALLVTVMVFSSGKNNGVANLLGYIPLSVESDSMKPTFKQGDLIICKEVDDMNSLKVDDVITFWTTINGKRVKNTHRIVEIVDKDGSAGYVTRGDNNAINDTDVISPGAVIGRWTNVKLPLFGKIMNFLRTKTGFFICIVIPMAIFFLFELYKFIATIIEVKRPEPVEIDEEEIKRRAVEEYLASQKQSETAAAPAADVAEKLADTAEKAEDAAEKLADNAEDAAFKEAEKRAAEAAAMVEEAVRDAAETAETVGDAAKETADIAE